jgi:hypothetical protein
MGDFITKKLITVAVFLTGLSASAQNNFFADANERSFTNAIQQRVIIPAKYRTILLDTFSFGKFLKNIPLEKNIINRSAAPIIKIPMPDGSFKNFHIWQTAIMEPALAKKFSNIKTFTGQGIEDRAATIKIDWTELGFHAMILSTVSGHVFIDPYTQGSKTNYISYFKSDFKEEQRFVEQNLPGNNITTDIATRPANITANACVGSQLLTYRLAIACTDQYAAAATGLTSPTVAQTLAAIVTTIQRVNGIYETELSISLVLVADEDAIIFNNPSTDPLKQYNINISSLIQHGQTIIDTTVGDANYDVGEIFSTGAGGGSYVGVVCQQGQKSGSAIGVPHPVGDPFNVDYVSHEIGHEFGAHHPFNSKMDDCGLQGQDYIGTNDEPGSGSTIMGYAGSDSVNGVLCGSDNLQPGSDPEFNGINFSEIINFINNQANCGVATATSNHPPVVNAGADYTIPIKTPFVLTGSATDPDGDSLTYSWEQVDVGGTYCAWNAPIDTTFGNAPLFRSFPPVSSPSRYFPKLSDVINNTTTIGEIMPLYGRTMHFRLTARDNRAGGGGVCNDENAITVDSLSGPFIVTYPDAKNIIWSANDSETVTWNPAGTQSAPVSCSNVMIQLSTDGGLTYPDTLLSTTPNTGTAKIIVPDNLTTTARLRVMSVRNVFYDISNNNFIIQSAAGDNCPSSDLLFASDITGTTYQWQVNNGSGYTNIVNDSIYTGGATNLLQLKDPPTSWYGYQYHCVVTGAGGTNNSKEITLQFGEQWAGTISTAWENPLNWSCGILPNANTDVIVNNGAPNFPIVNSNETVRSLTISPGASCTVNPAYILFIAH